TPHVVIDSALGIMRARGDVTLIIDNFVYVSGTFSFSRLTDPVSAHFATGPDKQVNILTDGAGVFDSSDNPAAHGAIGVVVHDLDFGLALLKPVDTGDGSSYYALVASAAQIALVGVPGVILSATQLTVAINGSGVAATGGGTPTAPPVVNFATSFTATGGLHIGSVVIQLSTRTIAASGQDLTLGLDFNTDGIPEISLSADVSFEKLTRPNGSEVIKVGLTDLAFVLGDPADPVFSLTGLAG